MRFHPSTPIRRKRCRMLRAERHPSARSGEQFVQQSCADPGAASVAGDEQVRQHHDTIDVDDTAERDDTAIVLRNEEAALLRSDQYEVVGICRRIALACNRVHRQVVRRRRLSDQRLHPAIVSNDS